MSIKIDKTELAQRINALEGLDNETKAQLLELLHDRKKYGLVWEEHPEDVEERLREELPVLVEDKSKAIISEDKDAPNHILIEGDNLEALTTLSYTHEGKIDVIYIDPPYNTGNKDFVYNDKFVDTEDEYRHSKWLSFMAKRLKIAKRLLSDKGVIFISIDDNEQAALKLLCDEVFEEKNRVANVTVKGNPRGRQSSSYFAQMHDYLIVYRKSEALELEKFPISDNEKKSRFNKVDDYGIAYEEWELRKRGADSRRIDSPNLWFPIYFNSTKNEISTTQKEGYNMIITPKLSSGEDGRWRWSREKVEKDKEKLYVRRTKSGSFNIYEKKYIEDKGTQLPPTIWDYADVNTELGTKLLKLILENVHGFDYPKPIGLLSRLISLSQTSSTILDFFAGSGTTLHATMQLNAEDGGHRQCILVTNNENNICEEVTYERNKRVINGYTTPKGETIEGLHKNTLRYYRTGFVARESSATAKRELMYASADMLCIKNDIYTEQKQFGTLRLRKDVARYFADGNKGMLVLYTPDVIETIVAELKTMEVKTPIITYIFSLNDYAMDADFEEVTDKVKLCALPAAILNAYYKVLPKRTRKENTL